MIRGRLGKHRGAAVALVAAIALGGCAAKRPAPVIERLPSTPAPAPAREAKPTPKPLRAPDPRPDTYVVKRGDTLYNIALDQGLDYRELAEWNGINNVNVIRVGQELRLKPPPGAVARPAGRTEVVEAAPLSAPDAVKSQPKAVRLPYSEQALASLSTPAPAKPEVKAEPVRPAAPAEVPARSESVDDEAAIEWSWPATGKVIGGFSESASLKGIGIAGKAGQPVLASAGGRVVYSGSGLRGYGKLIIIKHNREFLTVYAHNNELLVKEGQTVVRGQKIAEMGNTDADQVKLHFEIRRFGKPVDPTKVLPERPA